MNLVHRLLCSSSRWKQTMQKEVLPWSLDGLDLGSKLLEIGPGYGAATELLNNRGGHLTCVEVDTKLAEDLRERMRGRNVRVMHEDATATSLPEATFDAAVCFTMLHHVPSPALQDRLLREVFRLLRPGGIFAGTDSLDGRLFRFLHLFDTLVIVNPDSFPARLTDAGFEDVYVDRNSHAFRFRARKPLASKPSDRN
ncbi:MAG: class I SAM-dependent methyltransferase [Acidobacteriaceae bacterium]